MTTISDRNSVRTDINVKKNISHDEHKKKEDNEDKMAGKKAQLSSTDAHQSEKTSRKANDSVQIGKTDILSTRQSTNENKKSHRMSPTLNESSDNNTKKKNGGKTIKTTQQKEESRSTSLSSTSISTKNIKTEEAASSSLNNIQSSDDNNNESTTTFISLKNMNTDKSTAETTPDLTTKIPSPVSDANNDNAFPIEKDDAQHLTDFQLEKAKYFFHVNLDIENKQYVTWEDVEFYLLFHATAAGNEGSDGGDLEERLNRAAKAFWNHVHDQVPLPDSKRNTLTLDQFLDTWAGLIDYVVRTNQLPPIVQDLVRLGFELYATDNGTDKTPTIQPAAFDQLFQKMNIGRPYAIMAYKYLTENGTKPLDADKIDSIVKAVITSSDDEHDSHFLLPGFFKTIANNRNHEKDTRNKSDSPIPDDDLSQTSDKSSSISSPPSPIPTSKSPPINESLSSGVSQQQQQQPNIPSPPLFKEQQQPREPSLSPTLHQQNTSHSPSLPRFQPQETPASLFSSEQKLNNLPSFSNQTNSIPQQRVFKSPTRTSSSTTQQQQQQQTIPPKRQKHVIQQEDENIRSLLRYYHIDDGDVFEVSDGSLQRLVLIHPERPLPPYIQHDKQLLHKLHSDPAPQQNRFPNPSIKSDNTNDKSSQDPSKPSDTKSNITLESRASRGDAQTRLATSARSMSPNAHQKYFNVNDDPSDEQRKKTKRHGTSSLRNKKKIGEETSMNSDRSTSRQDDKRNKKDITCDDEEKIVATVLKQLAPIVEKRVAEELRRIDNDETDQDEDDSFIPFPFMLAAGLPFFPSGPNGGPPPQSQPQESGNQQQAFQRNAASQEQQQNHSNGPRGADFGSATFMPPPLFMAMMSDLARGSPGGDLSGFPSNIPSSSRGPGGAPVGVEGFMMFVDDNQMMGGSSSFPTRSGPRY